MNKYKKGQKVRVFSKSIGDPMSPTMGSMIYEKRDYLYYLRPSEHGGVKCHVLAFSPTDTRGCYFLESDFKPYVENDELVTLPHDVAMVIEGLYRGKASPVYALQYHGAVENEALLDYLFDYNEKTSETFNPDKFLNFAKAIKYGYKVDDTKNKVLNFTQTIVNIEDKEEIVKQLEVLLKELKNKNF